MQYTDEAAKELQEKYNIPPATLTTWRHRGKIPDKYFKDYSPVEGMTPEQKNDFKNITRALSFKKINIAELQRISGVNSLKDVMREKSTLSTTDFVKLKKTVNNLRIEVKLLLSELEKKRTPDPGTEKKFKNFIENKAVYPFVIFDRNRDVWGKIDGWKRGLRTTFPGEVLNEIKGGLIVFLAETNI